MSESITVISNLITMDSFFSSVVYEADKDEGQQSQIDFSVIYVDFK
jgi:hypothetical protein